MIILFDRKTKVMRFEIEHPEHFQLISYTLLIPYSHLKHVDIRYLRKYLDRLECRKNCRNNRVYFTIYYEENKPIIIFVQCYKTC